MALVLLASGYLTAYSHLIIFAAAQNRETSVRRREVHQRAKLFERLMDVYINQKVPFFQFHYACRRCGRSNEGTKKLPSWIDVQVTR
jgi:hypothetical protein